MTLLFPFLFTFSPAETLATQHTSYIFFGYNRPEILSSFLPFYGAQTDQREIRKKTKTKKSRKGGSVKKARQNFISAKF